MLQEWWHIYQAWTTHWTTGNVLSKYFSVDSARAESCNHHLSLWGQLWEKERGDKKKKDILILRRAEISLQGKS